VSRTGTLTVRRFLGRDAIKVGDWIEKMIEHEPETSRVMKKQQWENHRERHPEGELSADRSAQLGDVVDELE
jgi:hypothetical protein